MKNKLAKKIFFLFLFFNCASMQNESSFNRDNAVNFVCDSINAKVSGQEQFIAIENYYLPFCKEVFREDSLLVLKLRNGKYDTLVNRVDQISETCQLYSFIYYYKKIGYFLLFEIHPEEKRIIMMNDSTSSRTYLSGIPLFSRDYSYFRCSEGEDVNTGYVFNIWRIQKGNIIKVFEKLFETPGKIIQKWESDTVISLTRKIDELNNAHYKVELVRRTKQWIEKKN